MVLTKILKAPLVIVVIFAFLTSFGTDIGSAVILGIVLILYGVGAYVEAGRNKKNKTTGTLPTQVLNK